MATDREVEKWKDSDRRKRERTRKKRIADRIKKNETMKYTPKERATYRRALRYGRRLKADNSFHPVPGIKWNGGRVAVRRDTRGNVSVFTNHPSDRESFSFLGPRGVKYATDLTSVIRSAGTTENAIKAGKIGEKILSIVTKGNFKRGSTGSRGG